ncbi:arabinan endo-1,5-alpha-L-arabinosidase [Metabacillus malikii]|uniref:Arabinan endo-1,5-alpha-L-arabinosidase n=1 Tax=Metabacillus malikii TaxID=1504265 RepID=A0ABT9ZF19_9BACI|nr:arabinan endo-1,5-alpha-L-arabinosidase [Metabacillus malikii]
MISNLFRKLSLTLLAFILLIPGMLLGSNNENIANANESEPPVFKNVSVHDPSIIKEGKNYYVFGSHIEAAKSTDLQSWTTFTNGYTTPNNVLYGDLSENLAESFKWAGEDDSDSKGGFAVWAPDIFWNADYKNEDGTTGAFMMYYSASSTYIRSAIGYAVSKNIEGPYTYVDTIVYSGFTKEEAYDADSDVNKKWTNTNIQTLIDEGNLNGPNENWFNENGTYNNQIYPNAIDANIFYDENGKLWMSYGSWSGGIFMLELDKETGAAIYPGDDAKTDDGRLIDRYFGTKIAGGYGKSGEGPYIVYDQASDYYYLYVTYGWLGADGGYNMRQWRAKNPEGPYIDAAGQDAVLPSSVENTNYGNKIMGNFLFERQLGEPGNIDGVGYVSPGHNSVFLDDETGQQFLVFHTRFPERGEIHEVRVHQMFKNKDGWPVVGAHRYSGETIDENVTKEEVAGEYKFINQGLSYSADINKSILIRLNDDNTITGDVSGTWSQDKQYASLTIDGETYNGVFVRLWDPVSESYAMTFTALSNKGVSIWGSKSPLSDQSDEEIVDGILQDLKLGNIDSIVGNMNLPKTGTRNTEIKWETSNAEVITTEGVVTRPSFEEGPSKVTLTATVTKGDIEKTKTFEVTVLPNKKEELIAHYKFEDDLSEETGNFAEGKETGNRIDNTGGTISYEEGIMGKGAVFNGESGVRLPDGLITSHSYTVSLWLNPEALTDFTTTFFGAKDENNWVSLVPQGPVEQNTMVWSGSSTWYDAPTGKTINTGEWTNVTFTVKEGDIKVYLNGEQAFEGKEFPHRFTTTNTYFGLGVNHWDTPFKGAMDELMIYEGALSGEEVKSYFDSVMNPEPPNEDDGKETPGKPGEDDGSETPGEPGGDDGSETPGKPGEDDGSETPGKPGGDDGSETPGEPGGDDGKETPVKPDEGDGTESPTVKPVVDNDDEKTGTGSEATNGEANKDGNTLPATATNQVNILLAGIVMLIIGCIVFVVRKNRLEN